MPATRPSPARTASRRRLAVLAAVVALGLASVTGACGDDDDSIPADQTPSAPGIPEEDADDPATIGGTPGQTPGGGEDAGDTGS